MTETFLSKTRGWSSLDAARWHMTNSTLTGTSWSVALVIAMHHNKSRGYAFPTIDKLVADTPFSRRSIARAIQEMKESGEWHITSGRGGPTSKSHHVARANRYYPLPKSGDEASEDATESAEEELEDAPSVDDDLVPSIEDGPLGGPEQGVESSEEDGTLTDNEGLSEVPGWHVTTPDSEGGSGARVAPHSQESGARVAPHSQESGARVAPHPPSEVPGWHPKREYFLKENQTGEAKGETRSLKEKIKGDGRSVTTSNSRTKNATGPTDLPPSLSQKNKKGEAHSLAGQSDIPLTVKQLPFFAKLHMTHQSQFIREWKHTSATTRDLFLNTASQWEETQLGWLAANSEESINSGEEIKTLLGWITKFGAMYQPYKKPKKVQEPNPDQATTAEQFTKSF